MHPGWQPRRPLRPPSSPRAASAARRAAVRLKTALAAVPLAVLPLVSGCGGSSPQALSATVTPAANGPQVTVLARSVPGVGLVLVNSAGYALYMFQPDGRRAVTCTGACAGTWPPLALPSGGVAVAGPGVKSSLLGSDPEPGGGRVVTYDGWPLYTYTGDVQAGQATGQGVDLNGGEWYVLRPTGVPLIPAP